MRMVLNLAVPRTGSVYIQETLSNVRKPHRHWHMLPSDWSHVSFYRVPDEYRSDYVIGVVRNPFDLLVSNYCLLRRMDVLLHHHDRDLACLEFRDWLTLVAHREGRYPKRYPLHFQYFGEGWKLCLDYLARFETLDADLARIADITGGTFAPRSPVNASSRNPDWREYYDEPMLKLVERTWLPDLTYFGYSRGGWDPRKALTTFGADPKPVMSLKVHSGIPWEKREGKK